MSFSIKGQKCVVCDTELTEHDDVVCCPVCSAPHHRECYASLGHCGLEHLHGSNQELPESEPEIITEPTQSEPDTENNTQKPFYAGRVCPACKKEVPPDTRFCPYCGVPVSEAVIFKIPTFDKNAEIEPGVTAHEVAKVVYLNPIRYVLKFLKLNKNHRISWNWAAFLVPGAWFAYRKMYKQSFVSTAFLLMAVLFNIPFNTAIETYLPVSEEGIALTTLFNQYAEYLPLIGVLPFILVFVGVIVNIAVRFYSALYGDWIYREHILEVIKKVKEAEDPELATSKLGGTTFIGFLIALCILEFLPSIIAMLLL